MRDCACPGICFLCACMNKREREALYWNERWGLPGGHAAIREALRVAPAALAQAEAAAKAKHEVIGGEATTADYLEALEALLHQVTKARMARKLGGYK